MDAHQMNVTVGVRTREIGPSMRFMSSNLDKANIIFKCLDNRPNMNLPVYYVEHFNEYPGILWGVATKGSFFLTQNAIVESLPPYETHWVFARPRVLRAEERNVLRSRLARLTDMDTGAYLGWKLKEYTLHPDFYPARAADILASQWRLLHVVHDNARYTADVEVHPAEEAQQLNEAIDYVLANPQILDHFPA